jgi:hypothetical protein
LAAISWLANDQRSKVIRYTHAKIGFLTIGSYTG